MANCCSSVFCEQVNDIRFLNGLVSSASTFGFSIECSNFSSDTSSIIVGSGCCDPSVDDYNPSFYKVGNGNSAIFTVGEFKQGYNSVDGFVIDNDDENYSWGSLEDAYHYDSGSSSCCGSGVTNTLRGDAHFYFTKFDKIGMQTNDYSTYCESDVKTFPHPYICKINDISYDCENGRLVNENGVLSVSNLNQNTILSGISISSGNTTIMPFTPISNFNGYISPTSGVVIDSWDVFTFKYNRVPMASWDYDCGSDVHLNIPNEDITITYYPKFRNCQNLMTSSTEIHKSGATFDLEWSLYNLPSGNCPSDDEACSASGTCITKNYFGDTDVATIYCSPFISIDSSYCLDWDSSESDSDLSNLIVSVNYDNVKYTITLKNGTEYKGLPRKFKIVIEGRVCNDEHFTLCSGLICQNGQKESSSGGCNAIPMLEMNCGDIVLVEFI